MQLTLVDLDGRRHVLRGLEGQSLVEVLQGHVDTLGEDSERARSCCCWACCMHQCGQPAARLLLLLLASRGAPRASERWTLSTRAGPPTPRSLPPARPPPPAAVVCLTPEGRGKWEAHVKVPTELAGSVPPPAGDDARYLAEIATPASLDEQ